MQHKTIDSMLDRGERLDSLVEKSSDLSISSQVGIFLLYVILSKDIQQVMAYGQLVKMILLSSCNPLC